MFRRALLMFVIVVMFGSACAADPQVTVLAEAGEEATDSSETASAAAEDGEDTAETAAVGPAEPPVQTLDRDEAISAFIGVSFLPQQIATCVVDELHDETGIWDPSHPDVAARIDIRDVITACSEADAEQSEPEGPLVVRTNTIDPDEDFELTASTLPLLTPGDMSIGSVELRGKYVDYVAITPGDFELGDTAPVFLAFPPGGQDLRITEAVAATMYATEALARGWVVVSPAAPDGKLFYNGSEDLVPEMIRWIEAWVTPEGGKLHVGGMSAGGISAFRVAAENPDSFNSLMVYPGFPRSNRDKSALAELATIPVHMWVGGRDDTWVAEMEAAAADLTAAGGEVTLTVLPDEPHVLRSTQDGRSLFDALDDAR